MKKRVLTVVTAALLLLSIPAVLLGWGFLLPPQYGDTFLGELKYKVQYLEEARGPRIVLVGGSGVAFGVDSALMERELPGYTVVNFGMYAALGTTVMLDLSEDLIRPGDIVILIPEQQEQTLSDFFDPAVMWQALDGAFPLLGRLPGTYRSALAGQFPYFAAQKYADLLQGRTPRPRGVYSRASFNAAGDVVSGLCSRNIMAGGYDPNTPIRFDSALATDAFLSRINAYARSVEERGATMWYAFCPMNAAAVEGAAGPDEFYDALQAALRFPVIGDPNQSILESGWFYDTNFHLNASGKIVYTRLLVRNIKAVLGDSSPTEIALPRQPAPAGADTWSGDDRDADCFLYREADGLLTVVGLSAGGLAREALTVPSAWNGLPVTAIGGGAFAGGARLREVVVQQNITQIADGAFSGCPALDRIRIRTGSPAGCRVGQGLLEGTDAAVYVPADALSDYRTDYFWSVWGQRVLPDGP